MPLSLNTVFITKSIFSKYSYSSSLLSVYLHECLSISSLSVYGISLHLMCVSLNLNYNFGGALKVYTQGQLQP